MSHHNSRIPLQVNSIYLPRNCILRIYLEIVPNIHAIVSSDLFGDYLFN